MASGPTRDVRWTLKTAFAVAVGVPAFFVFGIFLLQGAYESWTLGEMLLKRHPPVRLVTWAGQPTEFALRCLFLVALGGFFFTSSVGALLALLLRIPPLHKRFKAGPRDARVAVAVLAAPAICFAVWLALLFFLPIYYR